MKKNYFMLALASMMMAACANNDLVDDLVKEEVPQAIGFETFANKTTRAITDDPNTDDVNEATQLQNYHTSFGVWAYKTVGSTTTNVMPNYKVDYTAGISATWEYKDVTNQSLKYWDKQATSYDFYAYAPYAATGVSIDEGKISIINGEYAANENLQSKIVEGVEKGFTTSLNTKKFSGLGASSTTASTDWMIAEANNIANANFGKDVEEVFKHTMSKLIVILKSNDVATGTDVEVTEVSINNVYGSGSYNGTSWTPSGDAKSIEGLVGELSTTDGYYSMEYLLIPSTEAPTFSITYTVNGDEYTVSGAEITGIDKFEANTCYTLTATIGLTPIKFTASAVDFSQPGGSVTIQ